MALKFLKNPPLLSPPTSPPEKTPHPIATNVRAQNRLPPAACYGRPIGMTNTSRCGVKRSRDSSGDENSSEEDIAGGRIGVSVAGMAERRKVKRVRTGDHQWAAYIPREPPRESSSDEDEDEGDVLTPSPTKKTELNMGGLSLTPTDTASSEYASMNGLLKMLHLNRGSGGSRGDMSNPGSRALEGRKMQPLRPPASTTPQRLIPASEQPDDRQGNDAKLDEQKEKDSVTSIYEEANRALGRLMLDRRKLSRPPNMLDNEDSDADESDED